MLDWIEGRSQVILTINYIRLKIIKAAPKTKSPFIWTWVVYAK